MSCALVGAACGAAAVVPALASLDTPTVPTSPAAPASPPMSTLRRILLLHGFRLAETPVNQSVRIESTNGFRHVNGGFRRPVDGYHLSMTIAVIAHRGKTFGG